MTSRVRKVLVWGGIAVAVVVILPMVPECERYKAVVINNSGSPIEATLVLRDAMGQPAIWAGQLKRSEARTVASSLPAGGQYLELRGRYLDGGGTFKSGSDYALGFGEMTSVFIIKRGGVAYGYWFESLLSSNLERVANPSVIQMAWVSFFFAANIASCLDRDAMTDTVDLIDVALGSAPDS